MLCKCKTCSPQARKIIASILSRIIPYCTIRALWITRQWVINSVLPIQHSYRDCNLLLLGKLYNSITMYKLCNVYHVLVYNSMISFDHYCTYVMSINIFAKYVNLSIYQTGYLRVSHNTEKQIPNEYTEVKYHLCMWRQ